MHSVLEAAEKLGLTDRYVRLLLKRGELSGKKLGHDWVVLSLDYKRKRRPKWRGNGGVTSERWPQNPDEVWTEGSL